MPGDLAAIADKAMNVDPALRYQTAGEFAEDIKRWLRYEPTSAQPSMPWKRLWLWTRHKPTIASAITVVLIASICTALAVIESYKNQTQVAKAENRIAAIRLQRDRLQQELLGEHSVGWSENGWASVRKLVQDDSGGEIKSLAAATRLGVDAIKTNEWAYSPSYLAYNPAGTKLLMVQYDSKDRFTDTNPSEPGFAQVWDLATHQLQQLPQTRHDSLGPIAFRNDDPVQLVWNKKEPSAISLWSLEKQKSVGRMEFPFPLVEAPLSWSIIPSGSIASAVVKHEGAVHLFVWEIATGKTLAKIETNASAIELSPDGALVAAACAKGVIEVWSVTSGEILAKLTENHADTLCFAWTKDRTRFIDSTESGWLLAAGAYGGDLTIWDVDRKSARSHCIGSCFEIFSLAFSPDGMTLASAGRAHPMLWNVASGELLLRLGFDNTMTSIAYSPNGESLVVGSRSAWGSLGRTTVYEIQEIRGQQVLRGLRSRVALVRVSADNRFVAALSDNWQLAVWDLKLHRLLHVFQVPIGVYSESAGLVFEPSGRRIAVVSGSEARVWDTESGEMLKSVDLPPGFIDSVVFKDANTLISVRQESVESDFPPVGPNIDPDNNPRVCRVRNLLAAEPKEPLLTIPDFKRTAVSITVTPSGERLLIEGYYEGGEVPQHRVIKLFDLPAGTERWKLESDAYGATAHRVHAIDPGGGIIAMLDERMHGQQILVDLESKVQIRMVEQALKGLGPRASLNIMSFSDPGEPGKPLLAIVQGEKDRELLRLGVIKRPADGVAISTDERYFAYGCSDGSVVVTDLWSVQRKLAEVGLR